MKRLLTTYKQLNEKLSNFNLIKSYLNNMWKEILSITNLCDKEIFHNLNYILLEFNYYVEYEKEIEKVIKKYIKKLEIIDIISNYTLSKFSGRSKCSFIIKELEKI